VGIDEGGKLWLSLLQVLEEAFDSLLDDLVATAGFWVEVASEACLEIALDLVLFIFTGCSGSRVELGSQQSLKSLQATFALHDSGLIQSWDGCGRSDEVLH